MDDRKNEDIVGDWEDLLEEEDVKPQVQKKSPTSDIKNGEKIKSQNKKKVPEEETLTSALEEKMKNQKLVEEADQKLMVDLFSGCDRPELATISPSNKSSTKKTNSTHTPAKNTTSTTMAGDSISKLELKSLKDCELFAEKISEKIQNSQAKSPAWLRLLDLLFKDCAVKMDVKDLNTLKNKVQHAIKQKEDAKRDSAAMKKKPNDKGNSMKDFRDEMDLFYGEISEEDEEDEDYYNDFI